MTEAEWLKCDDLARVLGFARDRTSDRKLRLLAAACCRRVWRLLADERSRQAVDVAEQYADGQATPKRLIAARRKSERVRFNSDASALATAADAASSTASLEATAIAYAPTNAVAAVWKEAIAPLFAQGVEWAEALERVKDVSRVERDDTLWLIREIVGNPFRPVALDPARRTPTAVSLAQAAYDERRLPSGALDPAHLAILSDALEESGCTDADILSHLRSPGPHVRGCFALDLILGKS